ncbi:hypothetical protein AAE02nite_23110 [Adhaeribacter aerolatus]|uniref:Uncharacterized protein n=1 Tax=Adhaeribacter aerolatus TaxID=670289 RepID=A0A512AYR2_9BACT|nr:hypothetical protein [Adhaeribacter aerolatus]GEO04647.1 hypothetical protein AAE02nite_23110 [Adhaeribacter aerolatus]
MKKLMKLLPAVLMAGLVNVYAINAATLEKVPVNKAKDFTSVLQDTTTNKARAKKGAKEVGSGAKEVGKGTKDLAVSGAKATGKGAKKAGKAVKHTAKKGAEKVDKAVD